MALNIEQVAASAHRAGFRGENLYMAVAVAWAESGWRPEIKVTDSNGCPSYGLMQINVCPSYQGKGKWYYDQPEQLRQADPNMKAAFEMSGGGANWRPWTTQSKARADIARIKRELAGKLIEGAPADDLGPSVSGVAAVPGFVAEVVNPFERMNDFFRLLSDWDTWRRVLLFVGGAALVGLGLSYLGQDLAGSLVDKLGGDSGPAPAAIPTTTELTP